MITLKDWQPYTIRGTLEKTALIHCPTCRKAIILGNYQIDESGIVTPRVACSHCQRNIGDIRLSGWPFEIDITS